MTGRRHLREGDHVILSAQILFRGHTYEAGTRGIMQRSRAPRNITGARVRVLLPEHRVVIMTTPSRLSLAGASMAQAPLEYYCDTCAEYVAGTSFDQRGVTRIVCERCDSLVIPRGDL